MSESVLKMWENIKIMCFPTILTFPLEFQLQLDKNSNQAPNMPIKWNQAALTQKLQLHLSVINVSGS